MKNNIFKSRTFMLVVAMVAGISLFAVATVTASAGNVDYERLKDIMTQVKDVKDLDEGQVTINFSMTDNGEQILDGVFNANGNKVTDESRGTAAFTIDGTEKNFEFYTDGEQLYLMDVLEGKNYVMNKDHHEDYEEHSMGHKRDFDDDEISAAHEEILDYLMGDLKDNFIVTDLADGSTNIEFNMAEEEVPTLLNLFVKAGSAKRHHSEDMMDDELGCELPFMEGINKDVMPKLSEDVQIKSTSVNAVLDSDNILTGLDLAWTVSGIDENGNSHTVTTTMAMTINHEEVTITPFDIDAYEWQEVEIDESECHGHRGPRMKRR